MALHISSPFRSLSSIAFIACLVVRQFAPGVTIQLIIFSIMIFSLFLLIFLSFHHHHQQNHHDSSRYQFISFMYSLLFSTLPIGLMRMVHGDTSVYDMEKRRKNIKDDDKSNTHQDVNKEKSKEDVIDINNDDKMMMVQIFTDKYITFFKYLPLRTISRIVGYFASINIPIFMRNFVIGSFSHYIGCQLNEAEIEDLKEYSSLGSFFRRSLKPYLRPIHQGNSIVSPVDGRILHFGEVKNGLIEQVKGVNFSLPAFLGPQTWWANQHCQDQQSHQQQQHQSTPHFNNLQAYVNNIIQTDSDNCLYCCVIYLAPNDYHRFHSPTQWNVQFRRHFPGQLLSVRPSFVERIKGLFAINERVCYYGSYDHGFFSMTAVGATNVGSVTTYFDRDLKTNKPEWGNDWSQRNDRFFETPLHFQKGDAFGEFNLGSTIVLVFEAPKNWKSTVEVGDKIKFGEPLVVPGPVGKSRHNRKISQSLKQI